ncbi:MAG TPA: 3-oxoacyl-[acyl-carrier-protein] synthase III C-terminal domain-containing protein [Planktothrix sp.]|jgi:3-oxoacyl-[acyl-carrier-protein] synthase-3
MDVFVDHLSYALGEDQQSVEEAVASGLTVSELTALKDAGFQKHHMCRAGSTAYQLAFLAVNAIKDELSDVGAIIYSTCIPLNGNIGDSSKFSSTRDVKHLMDFPASHLQADFGLNNSTVFGLNQQACTSMLGSLRMAGMLINSEPEIKSVLCVTADRFPETAIYEQAYNLISDGAAACLVSTAPQGYRLLAWHGITNGALAFASDDETVGSFFNYSFNTISRALQKANLTASELSWIVPQNTNRKAWQILSSLLRFDFNRVYLDSLGEVGHVISGDNIINLKHLEQEKQLTKGERVLLFMAGYGLNWQCVILEKA